MKPARLSPLLLGFAVWLISAGTSDFQGWPWKERPEKLNLASAIPCIYQRDRASPTTVVGLFIAGGKSAVPEGLDGLAYLATRLALEIPDEGKVQDLMAQATRLSLFCSEDGSIILIECLSDNLDAALEVASNIIQDPLLTGLRVGREKDMMKLYGRAGEDDSVALGRGAVMGSFYSDKGYGSAVYGTDESLKAIDRKDVLAYYRQFFTKRNMFFCIETDLAREPVQVLLEKHFDRFPDGAKIDIPGVAPAVPGERDISVTKDTKQTFVGRAFALSAPSAPCHAQGYLLETLLGKGPGSRLWGLRMNEKLAYNVDAELTWTKSSGILEAYLETDNAKSARASEALDRTLSDLRENGVTEEELQTAKTLTKARFLRSTEAKAPRLRTLGLFEVLGLGYEHLTGIFGDLDAVTLEALNAFIREALAPERALKVTIGPAGTGQTQGNHGRRADF